MIKMKKKIKIFVRKFKSGIQGNPKNKKVIIILRCGNTKHYLYMYNMHFLAKRKKTEEKKHSCTYFLDVVVSNFFNNFSLFCELRMQL